MATRITPVNPAEAQPKAKELLVAVQAKLGMTSGLDDARITVGLLSGGGEEVARLAGEVSLEESLDGGKDVLALLSDGAGRS